MHITLQIFKVA